MQNVTPSLFAACLCLASVTFGQELANWLPLPAEWKGATVADGAVEMSADKWSYLVSPADAADAELSATVTIQAPAKQTGFFGQSWSAWPDPLFGDGGFEAGLLLRSGANPPVGYRVQLSHKYQSLALVKFPEGGYVQVVPCEVKL